MELHGIESARITGDGGVGTVRGVRGADKALGQSRDLIGVAHEADLLLREAVEEDAAALHLRLRAAILARLARGDRAAERPVHELHAVADAEDRHAEVKERLVAAGRAVEIDAVGSSGEDDADGIQSLNALKRRITGENDGIDPALAHAAGNELFILSSEIEDDDSLIRHAQDSFFVRDQRCFIVFHEKGFCKRKLAKEKSPPDRGDFLLWNG